MCITTHNLNHVKKYLTVFSNQNIKISKASNTFKLASVGKDSRNITNKMKSMSPTVMFTWKKKDTNNGVFKLGRVSKTNKAKNNSNNYLEVSSLVKRIRGPEDSYFPLKHVVLVNEFYSESLDGLLLKAFIFEGKCP